MNVAILVPMRAGVHDRDRLWVFARRWWENDFPGVPIIEGHHNTGPFNRSKAINTAAAQAPDADVFVIIDADTICDKTAVNAAIQSAYSTDGMVIAGDERVMLNKVGTNKILGGYRGDWRPFATRTYMDGCSCCVVVSRKLWELVGGFDELFVGWGHEDIAFRIACESMSGVPMMKVSVPMWHLDHRTSPENDTKAPLYKANQDRYKRYQAAARKWQADHSNRADLEGLLEEARVAGLPVIEPVERVPSRIPRIAHRTLPAAINEESERWWSEFAELHPGWELRTYREPLNPKDWPLTGDLWPRCQNGAQKAGLVRLEALIRDGGVYLDADVEPVRSFEPLLHSPAFAAWEDEICVPDAVLGAEPNHPALVLCLEKARAAIQGGANAWHSGPGVTTEVLPGRHDVLVLPPGAFFPYHYLEKHRADEKPGPWVFAIHRWAGSWLTEKERASLDKRQRQVR